MNRLKQSLDVLLVATCILSAFVLYGCGAQSLGPQIPLLPTIEGNSKLSARSQLEKNLNSSITYRKLDIRSLLSVVTYV